MRIITSHAGVRRAALLVAAAAAIGLAVPEGALSVPPGGPRPSHNGAKVKLSKTKVRPGGRIGVTGRRFPASKHVSIKLDDDKVGVIAVIKINRRGRFHGRVRIPRNVTHIIRPGRHWLRFLAPASSRNHQSNTSVAKHFKLRRPAHHRRHRR